MRTPTPSSVRPPCPTRPAALSCARADETPASVASEPNGRIVRRPPFLTQSARGTAADLVDSTDHRRIDEAAEELGALLEEELLEEVPLLVFANKQDLRRRPSPLPCDPKLALAAVLRAV